MYVFYFMKESSTFKCFPKPYFVGLLESVSLWVVRPIKVTSLTYRSSHVQRKRDLHWEFVISLAFLKFFPLFFKSEWPWTETFNTSQIIHNI